MGLPEGSVTTSVGDVSSADLAELRNAGQAREFNAPDLPNMAGREFEHMEGSRYDGVTRGYSGAEPVFNASNEPPLPQAHEQQAYTPQPAQEEPNYQQKYGQALNDMGEWRRAAQEAQSQAQLLMQQMAEVTNRMATQPQQQYQQPQPQLPPQRLFPDKTPGELMTWGEMEDLLNQQLLPAIATQNQQSIHVAKDWAAAETQRMLPTWDVQSGEEAKALQQLRSTYANFDNRFTAVERNNSIRNQVALNRQSQPSNSFAQPPQATPVGRISPGPANGGNGQGVNQPTRTMVVDPSRMVRTQTYVESSAPAQVSSEPSQALAPGAALRAEVNKLDVAARAQGRQRASAQEVEAVMARYGVNRTNDWGGQGTETILSR